MGLKTGLYDHLQGVPNLTFQLEKDPIAPGRKKYKSNPYDIQNLGGRGSISTTECKRFDPMIPLVFGCAMSSGDRNRKLFSIVG